MYLFHNHPLLRFRIFFIICIWLLATLVLSACSTPESASQSQSKTQQAVSQGDLTEPSINKEKNINVKQKKIRFFAFLKPIILAENEIILQQRQRIIKLQQQEHLDTNDMATLQQLAQQYGISLTSPVSKEFWQTLLYHIDVIPLTLALVQAANESAWGTSRFAREGNNYFGQWCFRKGCGMVPSQRSSDATHEVRRFKNAAESVQAYMRNINTSRAYTKLRDIRSNLRQQNLPIDAEALTLGLKHYSERGMAYVKTLQSMIRSNKALLTPQTGDSIPIH